MRIRNDFVSNSSSTIFVVISTKKKEKFNFNYQDIEVPNFEGVCDFGWGPRDDYDIWSKINFCAIQLIDLRNLEKYIKEKKDVNICGSAKQFIGKFKRYYEMFESVCKNELKLDITLKDDLCRSYHAYIDHQSSVVEGNNMEMFESQENLINFLTCSESYIHEDNDNE